MSDKHTDETAELLAENDQKITEDEEKLLDELGIFGESRRKFLGQASAAGLGILARSRSRSKSTAIRRA